MPYAVRNMAARYEPKRIPTGITGLDDILSGGLPSGQMYLLEGDPGTGKTTVAMQFIMQGVRNGEKALYITLSESRAELQASAQSHDWDTDLIPIREFLPSEANVSPEQQYTVFHPSEIELADTVKRLTDLVDQVRPDRLAIDSLSELRLLAADSMRYRRQLLALKQFFTGRQTTVLLLDDRVGNDSDLQLQSIAHGVIRLDKIGRTFGVTRRHMEIVKLRGSAFREGFHDYTIARGGVNVFPRLIASEHGNPFSGDRIESGVPELDKMFGGGLSRGSTTLVIGPTGSGKSNLSMQYAYAAACRGDRAIVYTFDEVLRTALDRAEALGMKVREQIQNGTLSMYQVNPADLSPGELASRIRSDVEDRDTRVVVIDSLSGYLASMSGERDLILHLHELIAYLNQKGVTTIIVMTQHGLVGDMQADVDVSYLSDTVLLLRYFEVKGELRRVLSVLKQRVGPHDHAFREFTFDSKGLEVLGTIAEIQGATDVVPPLTAGENL